MFHSWLHPLQEKYGVQLQTFGSVCNLLYGDGGGCIHVLLNRQLQTALDGGGVVILHAAGGIVDGTQAADEGLPGGNQFLLGDLAFLAGLQLLQNPGPDIGLLGAVNAGRDGENAFGAVIGRADGIAQGQLLPQDHEKLAGDTAAEHQMVAADDRPWMVTPFFMMTPAPRKPMPVTT